MWKVEQVPVPTRAGKSIADGLKKLEKAADSILIEHAKVKSVYVTASRLKIPIITRQEGEAVRVWRNFGKDEQEVPAKANNGKMSVEELREMMNNPSKRREHLTEIDRQAAPKDEFSGPQVVEAEWIP